MGNTIHSLIGSTQQDPANFCTHKRCLSFVQRMECSGKEFPCSFPQHCDSHGAKARWYLVHIPGLYLVHYTWLIMAALAAIIVPGLEELHKYTLDKNNCKSEALSSVLFLPLYQLSESWLSASYLSFYSLLCITHGWKLKTHISWRFWLSQWNIAS